MAIVQGIREKVHLPIYDCLAVESEKQLVDIEKTSTLKFFVNVQGKSKLLTNLQSASLLPHYNTFEARAMRVVISDLPPNFPDDKLMKDPEEFDVEDDDENPLYAKTVGNKIEVKAFEKEADATAQGFKAADTVSADVKLSLSTIMRLLIEARKDKDGMARIPYGEAKNGKDEIEFSFGDQETEVEAEDVEEAGGIIWVSAAMLEDFIKSFPEKDQPPGEQINPNDGAGNLISRFIYNTVTTFYVGEKIMIQMPTWFFPAGAGPFSESSKFTTHGEPNPAATFRFAEPIFISKSQNFRVEIEIPESDTLREIQKIYGPFNIWVVLDGYMTRDVQ